MKITLKHNQQHILYIISQKYKMSIQMGKNYNLHKNFDILLLHIPLNIKMNQLIHILLHKQSSCFYHSISCNYQDRKYSIHLKLNMYQMDILFLKAMASCIVNSQAYIQLHILNNCHCLNIVGNSMYKRCNIHQMSDKYQLHIVQLVLLAVNDHYCKFKS